MANVQRRGTVLWAISVVTFFGAGIWLTLHVGTAWLSHLRTLPGPWLLGLALVGGTASFFSPCGLALTPAFLGYLITGRSGPSSPAARYSLVSGSRWMAAGIVSFYAVVGLVVAFVGSLLYHEILYLNVLVGIVLVAFGPVLLLRRRLGWLEAWMSHRGGRTDKAASASALYRMGWAYGVASQSCAAPIFIGMVLIPLTAGSYWLGAATTVLYGAAVAGLLVGLVALGGPALVGRWQAQWGPWLQRVTGILFTMTGALLLVYAAQALGAL